MLKFGVQERQSHTGCAYSSQTNNTANAANSSQAKYYGGYGIDKSSKLILWVKSLIDGPKKFVCPALVIRLDLLIIILVLKQRGKDGNPLMSGLAQQEMLMDVFKYFGIIFGVVMVLSLEVLLGHLSPCDDSLVLPIGEKMHVYVVGSYDDKNAFWESTLFEGDRKYGLVSRKQGSCIQFGAKSYDLMVWDAMMCGYGSKGHSTSSFNMISGYSSFFMGQQMGQQYSREFNFHMAVVVKEICWRMFFTLNGLLNFVFDKRQVLVQRKDIAARDALFQ